MKNFSYALLALSALVACACSDKTVVRGKVADAPESDIVVKLLNVNVYETIDTVKTSKEGSFRFSLPVADGQPEFVYLFRGSTKIASLLVEKGERPFVYADTLGRYTVEGSEGSVKLAEVEKAYADFLARFNACADQKELSRTYVDYYRGRVEYVMKNPFSLTCIPVLFQRFSAYNPVFSQVTDAIQFRAVCDSLKKVYPDSKYVNALEKETKLRENRLALETRIASTEPVGFPDITMPDMKGNQVSLSKVDSKVVLLHFWDAADPMQKMLNIEVLLPIYREFHDKGLEIYSVCLDADKVAWASIVKSQQLPWINVNDGKGPNNQSLVLYGVTGLPTSIIISDGEIHTTPLKGEAGLRTELAKLLK